MRILPFYTFLRDGEVCERDGLACALSALLV